LSITFNSLGIKEEFSLKKEVQKVIESIVEKERKKLGEINYIFTDNKNILEINEKFLKHDYYTDVITFNNNRKNVIAGDIFISTEQILINSKKYNNSYTEELIRVLIHGVLHLIGYNDKSESEKVIMRKKEDTYLCLFKTKQVKNSE
jgi:probable rRNA maturation factor